MKRDYHAQLEPVAQYQHGAWTLAIGTIYGETWVVEYQSAASSRYQRHYFATRAEAQAEADRFMTPMGGM